jgi:phosphoglycolate phosphatase
MKKLLLFDIDGTLVSVERQASRQLLRDVVRETTGITLPADYVFQLGGKTDFQIMHEIARDFSLSPELIESRRNDIIASLVQHTENLATPELILRLAGVQELIAALAERSSDVVLGLLTGNIKQTAYLKLRPSRLGEVFAFGAFGCDHINRSALPPIAIHRANAASVLAQTASASSTPFTPENTIIIGDTLNDIACARAHAIPVLAVATGAVSYDVLAAERPDFLVHDFSNTAQIVDILTRQN